MYTVYFIVWDSKTKDPSNIEISVFVMYKIKPESIVALYLDYPSLNHDKDMQLTAKVRFYHKTSHGLYRI